MKLEWRCPNDLKSVINSFSFNKDESGNYYYTVCTSDDECLSLPVYGDPVGGLSNQPVIAGKVCDEIKNATFDGFAVGIQEISNESVVTPITVGAKCETFPFHHWSHATNEKGDKFKLFDSKNGRIILPHFEVDSRPIVYSSGKQCSQFDNHGAVFVPTASSHRKEPPQISSEIMRYDTQKCRKTINKDCAPDEELIDGTDSRMSKRQIDWNRFCGSDSKMFTRVTDGVCQVKGRCKNYDRDFFTEWVDDSYGVELADYGTIDYCGSEADISLSSLDSSFFCCKPSALIPVNDMRLIEKK